MSTYLDLAVFAPYSIEVQVRPASSFPFHGVLRYPTPTYAYVSDGGEDPLIYPLEQVTPILHSFRQLQHLTLNGDLLLLTILYSLLEEKDRELADWGKGSVSFHPSKSGGKLVAVQPKKNGNEFRLTLSRSWQVYGPYAGASHAMLAVHQVLRQAHVAVGVEEENFIPKKLPHVKPDSIPV